MYSDQSQIPDGATVYDSAGDKIGTVHENNVQGAYLVVQKGFLFHKDFYVPLSAIARADEEGVYLTVSTAELSDSRYDSPPMVAEAMGTTRGASNVDQSYAGAATTASTVDQAAYTTGSAARAVRTDVETGTGDIRVPVREEELVVGKRTEEEGRVHIHKDVISEQQSVDVALQQERVTVERVAFTGDPATVTDAFVERDIEVPLMGEEVVVGKQVKGVEEVVIRKDVTTEQQRVTDTVRKERVIVDGVDQSGQAVASDSTTRSTAGYSTGTTSSVGSAAGSAANAAGNAANAAGNAGQSIVDRAKDAAQTAADDLGNAKDKLTGR